MIYLSYFQRSPIIYKSLDNNQYIYKTDVFIIIQNICGYRKDSTNNIIELNRFLEVMYLKAREEMSRKYLEFVRFDADSFRKIEKKFEKFNQGACFVDREMENLSSRWNKGTQMETIFQSFKSLIPVKWGDYQYMILRNFVVYLYGSTDPEFRILPLELYKFEKWLEIFQKVFEEYPELFSPKRCDCAGGGYGEIWRSSEIH